MPAVHYLSCGRGTLSRRESLRQSLSQPTRTESEIIAGRINAAHLVLVQPQDIVPSERRILEQAESRGERATHGQGEIDEGFLFSSRMQDGANEVFVTDQVAAAQIIGFSESLAATLAFENRIAQIEHVDGPNQA